ncbi:hypothetical protein V6N11_018521 [Hibiscus sabdariffa]|uniref:Uncharacterized protein n=1 Tax=Hibiscus sabdariffa TaxID=183260 RepID=A0ABR2T7N6_9ROSI
MRASLDWVGENVTARELETETSTHQVAQEVLREMLGLPKRPPDLAHSRRLIESPHHGVVGTLCVNKEDAHMNKEDAHVNI